MWLKKYDPFYLQDIQRYKQDKNQRMKEDILWQTLIKNKNLEVNSLISDSINFREKEITRDKSIIQQRQASIHGKAQQCQMYMHQGFKVPGAKGDRTERRKKRVQNYRWRYTHPTDMLSGLWNCKTES